MEVGVAGSPVIGLRRGEFSTSLRRPGLRASSNGVLATKSERKMLASTCLYSLYAWVHEQLRPAPHTTLSNYSTITYAEIIHVTSFTVKLYKLCTCISGFVEEVYLQSYILVYTDFYYRYWHDCPQRSIWIGAWAICCSLQR